jgi:hypothetical protein
LAVSSYKLRSPLLCNRLQSSVNASLLGLDIPYSIVLSNNVFVYGVWRISHTWGYKATAKIVVLYILNHVKLK